MAAGHFAALVGCGLLAEADRLRFHTLVRCRLREHRQRHILHPGSLIVRSLRLGEWRGTQADEDHARQALAAAERRERPPTDPVVAEAVAGVLSSAAVPS